MNEMAHIFPRMYKPELHQAVEVMEESPRIHGNRADLVLIGTKEAGALV